MNHTSADEIHLFHGLVGLVQIVGTSGLMNGAPDNVLDLLMVLMLHASGEFEERPSIFED
jgi:hypothetical protein